MGKVISFNILNTSIFQRQIFTINKDLNYKWDLGKNSQEEAIDSFSDAIEKGASANFQNTDAYFLRGKTYWETGKSKKAIADFKN